MAHILIAGRIHQAGLAVLEARAGLTFEVLDPADEASITPRIPDADAILLRTAPLTATAIDRAPRLKVVSRHGVGFDNVDLEALTRRRIPLALAVGANAVSVAEQALFMMLELAKRGRMADRAVRENEWRQRDGLGAFELLGKRLLIVGFGRIGREVAARARPFGMSIVVHDPQLSASQVTGLGYDFAPDLHLAFAEADVVSLHPPRTPETVGMIGREVLTRMKPSAIVINTARGGLIDELALADALAEGRLNGAALDVFDVEPPPPDHPLYKLPNVLLSPHLGALTQEAAQRMAAVAAEHILAGLDNRLDRAVVANPEVLSI